MTSSNGSCIKHAQKLCPNPLPQFEDTEEILYHYAEILLDTEMRSAQAAGGRAVLDDALCLAMEMLRRDGHVTAVLKIRRRRRMAFFASFGRIY
jgi:predicted metal-binding protein